MADANLELEAVMRQVNSEMDYFGRITQATADQLRDAQTGVKGFSNAVREAPKALGRSASEMASAMYRGAQGGKAFNSSIDSMAQAADSAATVLSALIPGGALVRLLVVGLGKLVGAVGGAAKVAIEQSDATYKAFTQLSRAGAIGAEGSTGLANAAQRAGYNLLEMGDVIEKITSIAPQLALLSGTVSQGANTIHDMNAEMYKMGETMQRLGIAPEEQRAFVIQFTKQQIAMGRQMVGQFDASGQAIKNFVMESEALTRITGQQRQQQQDTLERAMSNEAFAATLDRLRQNKQGDVANQLVFVQKMLSGFSEQVQAGAADMASGRGLITKEAAQFNQATQGEYQRFVQRVNAGQYKSNEELTQGLEQVLNAMSQVYNASGMTSAQLKTLGDYSIKQSDFARAQAMLNQGISKSYNRANSELQGLTAGTDDLTSAQAKQAQIQRQLTTNLQALTQMAVPAAVDGLNATASAANAAAEALLRFAGQTSKERAEKNTPSTPGAPGMGGSAPGGPTGPFNRVLTGDPFASFGPEQLKKVEQLRDLIARVESEAGGAKGSGYTKLVGGKDQSDLTDMTLDKVLALQQQLKSEGKSGAVGRYQVIPETLQEVINSMRDLDVKQQKFDKDFQDKVANVLIARRGYRQYAENPTNKNIKEQVLKELNKEWRGLPNKPGMQKGDKSDPEANDPNLTPAQREKYKNKAGVGWDEALQNFAKGGIANMPDTGGLANLHGTEAVVPLPDGKTIPVVVKNDFSDIRKQQPLLVEFEKIAQTFIRDSSKIKQPSSVEFEKMAQAFSRDSLKIKPPSSVEFEKIANVMTKDFSSKPQYSQIDMEQLTRNITGAVQNAANSITNNLQLQPILTALNEITNYQRRNVNVNERMLRNHAG